MAQIWKVTVQNQTISYQRNVCDPVIRKCVGPELRYYTLKMSTYGDKDIQIHPIDMGYISSPREIYEEETGPYNITKWKRCGQM